jgi:hypothetical protein
MQWVGRLQEGVSCTECGAVEFRADDSDQGRITRRHLSLFFFFFVYDKHFLPAFFS